MNNPKLSRAASIAGFLSVGALALLCVTAHTAMIASKEILLDFTKPQEIAKKARWSDPQYVKATEGGLALIMAKEDGVTTDQLGKVSRDIWIETIDPIAVGWSWRPVYAVHIGAEKIPAGKFHFIGSTTVFPSGQMYARYSPDAVHWSTWQALLVKPPDAKAPPEAKAAAKQVFEGELRVPSSERQRYSDVLWEYAKLDVPWKSDEEAAVKWILEREPGFFEKNLPFIGYVQFHYEASLRGDERLKGLQIRMSYSAGGMASVPKDENVRTSHTGEWRFRADGKAIEGEKHAP